MTDSDPMAQLLEEERSFDATEALDRHAPVGWRQVWGVSTFEQLTDHIRNGQVTFTVVSFDIRKSTLLAKEVDPWLMANEVAMFARGAWYLVRSKGGFFGKYTGDGFMAFWLNGSPFSEGWEPKEGRPAEALAVPLGVARCLISTFETLTQPALYRQARNWPSGAGIAAGIDAGMGGIGIIANELEIFGPTVVGATRMTEVATAGELVANVNLGHRFLLQQQTGIWQNEIRVERVRRFTKEFPERPAGGGGQDVFLLDVRDPIDLLERWGGGFPKIPRAPGSQAPAS